MNDRFFHIQHRRVGYDRAPDGRWSIVIVRPAGTGLVPALLMGTFRVDTSYGYENDNLPAYCRPL